MKISIFGIGYVGSVASACLADSAHDVIAVDPHKVKVDCINQGRSPIIEKDLDRLIKKNVDEGRLSATTNCRDAVLATEMSLICVGTPSQKNGSLDYKYINQTCKEIGRVLREKKDFHIVVIRSTVVPGTLMNVVKPILEKESGKRAGIGFGLGNNPEFLRESTAVEDYFNPTQIVVGATDPVTAKKIMSLYDGMDAPRTITEPSVAESVKYISNAWRANKISFANEVGNILKHHDIDSHEAMDIFFQDKKINMGSSFLKPGFAFGGSCLPKDVKALRCSANDKGIPTPLFDSMLHANELQVKHAFDMIWETKRRSVGLLGLSFKAGTDDLRDSPLVTLAELLLKMGYRLKIYDPCVDQARQMNGSNKSYIENGIPHITRCLVSNPDELIRESEILVIGNGTREFVDILEKAHVDTPIIDLVRLHRPMEARKAYAGICW